ncbi:MAG TPA: hypothetical protein VHQ66_06330 [Myxococcota bacterium]|nr:hypothetical protein [Myxococcota bacterium]
MSAERGAAAAPRPLSKPRAALAFGVVAAGTIALALPRVLAGWPLWRDSVEYAAMAWNLANGQGLVDPIQYSNYMRDLLPPLPGLAVRPVVLSVLLAVPLALGASLSELRLLHIVWGSLIGASGVWVARRSMAAPAAVAFAVAVGWSYVWVLATQQFMSEATASGFVLLAIALYPGFATSHARAVALGAAVFVGWLARPNLAVLAVAVPLATALHRGWRSVLRPGPCWSFLGALVGLVAATTLAHWAATGLVPYAHYGVMFEVAEEDPFRRYQYEYRGWEAFLTESGPQIAAAVQDNLRQLVRELFDRDAYLHVGWLALPAFVHAFLRRRSDPQRMLAACSALLLLASAVMVTFGFSSLRYPLPGAVATWYVVCAALGDLGAWLARGARAATARPVRALAGAAAAVPLLVVGSLSAADNWWGWLQVAPRQLNAVLQPRPAAPSNERKLRPLCRFIDPHALVASDDPWDLYLACGNAGVKLPDDLDEAEWVERYLAEVPLGYVVLRDGPELRALRESPRLQRVVSRAGHDLFALTDRDPRSRPWTAPPRLTGAGSWRPLQRRPVPDDRKAQSAAAPP